MPNDPAGRAAAADKPVVRVQGRPATLHVAVEEANPLVRQIGLGPKFLLVSALLLLLWRLRPHLLWSATAAYAFVVAYHVLGVTVLAG